MNNNISRRKFFGTVGTVAVATTLLSACKSKDKQTITPHKGKSEHTAEEATHHGYLEIQPVTLSPIPCTGCKGCMPCPYGLNIPAIFSFVNNNLKEKRLPLDNSKANYAELRRDFLISLDRQIQTVRQPNHCIGCGQCMEGCPQEIQIPDEMQNIDNFIENLKRENV